MRFPRAFCLFLVLFVLLLTACEETPLPPLKINKGEDFPAFNVKDIQGEPIAYQHQPGKVSIINIWATWCGPCRYELPSLQRLQEKLGHEKFSVIGLSVDSDDHLVREFLIDRKISYPNYLDTDMTIVNDTLGIRIYPSTYLVSSDGVVQDVIEGWREWDDPALLLTIRQLNKK